MNYKDFKTIIPFPSKLTHDLFRKIERQIMFSDPKGIKKARKEWTKKFSNYNEAHFKIGKTDFGSIKTIKKLPTILKNPIFENIFSAEISKKEASPGRGASMRASIGLPVTRRAVSITSSTEYP